MRSAVRVAWVRVESVVFDYDATNCRLATPTAEAAREGVELTVPFCRGSSSFTRTTSRVACPRAISPSRRPGRPRPLISSADRASAELDLS
jgi:hypothetical protein